VARAGGVEQHTTLEDPMSRRHSPALALLATAALAALAPSPAQAKQINGLTVCGADGCRAVERAIGQALHDVGGATLAAAPRAAAHFRLVLKMGDGHRTLGESRLLYVPSERAIGGDGGWSEVSTGSARKLARAIAGRDALPGSALAKDVAALTSPATSMAPEAVTPPPASPSQASSADGPPWWLLGAGALAVLAVLGFAANAQVRRR
jgi:hypothetical protein